MNGWATLHEVLASLPKRLAQRGKDNVDQLVKPTGGAAAGDRRAR